MPQVVGESCQPVGVLGQDWLFFRSDGIFLETALAKGQSEREGQASHLHRRNEGQGLNFLLP